MAIVQISRIQNRRGRELTSIGIPQLASGEIGWAIDTQKMYIGNGAVSEGAPAVGNTEILTEHSNIFSLADQYIYKRTSNLWGSTTQVAQTLEAKLDAFTSVKDFGAVGDGLGTDDTAAFQAAIDGLYLRSLASNEKVTLKVPAGEYLLTDTLYIPPLVSIEGDGVGRTILYTNTDNVSTGTGTDPMFKFVNGTATPGVYNNQSTTVPVTSSGTNQARHCHISGMTLRNNRWAATFDMIETARSTFRDLRIEGVWVTGGGDFSPYELQMCAFIMTGTGDAQCIENIFENIHIFNAHTMFRANHDAHKNHWKNIRMSNAKFGYTLGEGNPNGNGFSVGPSWCTIEDCEMDLIYETGVNIEWGNYNSLINNKFYSVGNNGGDESLATYPVVKFTNGHDNTAVDNYFKRTVDLTPRRVVGDSTVLFGFPNLDYVPEIEGRVDYKNSTRGEISIGSTSYIGGNVVDILRLPLYSKGVVYLDYVYESERVDGANPDIFTRQSGTMELHYDSRQADFAFNHDFEFQGDSAYLSDFVFDARQDDIIPGGYASAVITCKNLIPITADKFIYNFRVRS